MYCSRPVCRSPSVVRVVRPASKYATRQASFLSQPFFNRFPGSAISAHNEFAPFFRVFDELTAPINAQFRQQAATFQPRFDVREVGENYEVSGELPGVESKDIEVEFSDQQTLIVRGRTESQTTSGTPPAVEATPAETEMTNAVADDKSDAGSTYSTGSYQKPSVEDEGAEPQATPAESTTEEKAPEPEKVEAEEPQKPTSRYWVSERTTGSFQRVFKFQSRIDQEAVKASLKNGVLSIVVPKAAAPAAKRINVE